MRRERQDASFLAGTNEDVRIEAGWLYRVVQTLVLFCVRIFYRRQEVWGAEQVPRSGPLIFAVNHHNHLIDPFLLGVYRGRKIHLLAKSTLFGPRWISRLLRSLGVLPVYRRMDQSPTEKNQETFARCNEILTAGGAIGIFPEGTSHGGDRILPLKTGVARIAFGAIEQMDGELPVVIVPVGLNYLERDVFRSDVLVLFGEPIPVEPLYAEYRADPQRAVRQLTGRVQAELEELAGDMVAAEERRLLDQVEGLVEAGGRLGVDGFRLPPENLREARERRQAILAAYEHFRERDPERIRKLRSRIRAFAEGVAALALDGESLAAESSRAARSELLRAVGKSLLWGPFVLWGLLNNFIPYRIPGWWTRKRELGRQEIATTKLAIGLISFPAFWTAQTGIVAFLLGWRVALTYLLGVIWTGAVALRFLDRWDGLSSRFRLLRASILARDLVAWVLEERDSLLAELGELAKDFGANTER